MVELCLRLTAATPRNNGAVEEYALSTGCDCVCSIYHATPLIRDLGDSVVNWCDLSHDLHEQVRTSSGSNLPAQAEAAELGELGDIDRAPCGEQDVGIRSGRSDVKMAQVYVSKGLASGLTF